MVINSGASDTAPSSRYQAGAQSALSHRRLLLGGSVPMIERIYTVKDHQPRQFQSMIPKSENRFSEKIMLKQSARDAKCRAPEDQRE
jgi:hypothetical protein